MSVEANKALVRRCFEAHSKGDLDAVEELLAPDFVDHDLLPGQEEDREGYKQTIAKDHAAFSNLRYIIEKQVAEGDEVVSRVTISGTHDRGSGWVSHPPARISPRRRSSSTA